jgi:hypothetical protein
MFVPKSISIGLLLVFAFASFMSGEEPGIPVIPPTKIDKLPSTSNSGTEEAGNENSADHSDDPLYQLILKELRGDQSSVSEPKTEKGAADSKELSRLKLPVEFPKSKLRSEDWRAIELMLKVARLLKNVSKDANEESSPEMKEFRNKLAQELRAQAAALVTMSEK